MAEREPLFSLMDLPAAFGLLTRLPMPVSTRGARAGWFWPFIGVVVAMPALIAGWLCILVGLPVPAAAIVVLAVMAGMTGAMHEDGLADMFDGLFGGHDRTRRLEIMKDSRIGTFGALALILVTLLKCNSIMVLMMGGPAFATGIVAAAALSRVAMLVLMALLPNARASGLSRLTGRPEGPTVLAALALGLGLAALCVGFAALKLAVIMGVVTLAVGLVAQQKIKGQTGDILGANQQLCEAFGLALLAGSVTL